MTATESTAVRAGASTGHSSVAGRPPATCVRVRPFTDADYAAAVTIANRSFPDYGDTVAEWRFWDAHRDAKIRFARFVGEVDDRVVATASYDQSESMYHPRKFSLEVTVDPDLRHRGIGSQMYHHLRLALAPHDPLTVHAQTREDLADSVAFATHRGFREVMRAWESRLDLASFDATPYAEHVAAFHDAGLRAATLESLARDPDRDRKLYDLVEAVARDVPSPEPHTAVDFDVWAERTLLNPDLLPALYWVALDGDRYVGLSNMWASQHDPTITYTGLTGTRREARRRGIALALKVMVIGAARGMGYRQTRTWNETGNEGMLSINVRLGFVRQPAWITFARDIGTV